jgi:hypothetical protein
VREKLGGYSLRLVHPGRGRKAEGFARVLAITADDLEYLAEALLGVERRLNPAREAAVVPLVGGMTGLGLAGFARS